MKELLIEAINDSLKKLDIKDIDVKELINFEIK